MARLINEMVYKYVCTYDEARNCLLLTFSPSPFPHAHAQPGHKTKNCYFDQENFHRAKQLHMYTYVCRRLRKAIILLVSCVEAYT